MTPLEVAAAVGLVYVAGAVIAWLYVAALMAITTFVDGYKWTLTVEERFLGWLITGIIWPFYLGYVINKRLTKGW